MYRRFSVRGKSLGLRDRVRREFNFERSNEGTGITLSGGERHPAAQWAFPVERSANRIDLGFASAARGNLPRSVR
jgi:hypothetical protein